MSMESVTNHYSTLFSDMMHIKAQQKNSRFRPLVEEREINNADDMAYDGLGQVEAREITARFSAIQFDNIDHTRRRISCQRFSVVLPMDKNDTERKLGDLKGQYATAALRAMERVYDKVAYAALFADVLTGRDFTNTLTATNDGVLTVDATGGLDLGKLLKLKQNFLDREVSIEDDIPVAVGISGDEHTTLLQLEKLTSRDYAANMQLERGRLRSAVGLDFILFGASVANPLLTVTGGVRKCFALAKGGVVMGIKRRWEVKLQERTDLHDTEQLVITGEVGGTRTDGNLVQILTVTDAA